MNSAKLERNKAALTVTATTSTRAKGAAMIAEAGAQAMRKSLKTSAPHCSTSVERTPLLLLEYADFETTVPRKLCGGTTERGMCQTYSKGLAYASDQTREVKKCCTYFTEIVSKL